MMISIPLNICMMLPCVCRCGQCWRVLRGTTEGTRTGVLTSEWPLEKSLLSSYSWSTNTMSRRRPSSRYGQCHKSSVWRCIVWLRLKYFIKLSISQDNEVFDSKPSKQFTETVNEIEMSFNGTLYKVLLCFNQNGLNCFCRHVPWPEELLKLSWSMSTGTCTHLELRSNTGHQIQENMSKVWLVIISSQVWWGGNWELLACFCLVEKKHFIFSLVKYF